MHVKEMEVEKKAQNETIQKLGSQLHTAHTSVHNLHTLYRTKHKDGLTDYENLELRSQLDSVQEEFTSKISELEEKIQMLITEVELARHERDILSERLDGLQSNAVQTKKWSNVHRWSSSVLPRTYVHECGNISSRTCNSLSTTKYCWNYRWCSKPVRRH